MQGNRHGTRRHEPPRRWRGESRNAKRGQIQEMETGSIIYATIEAADDVEAREKAARLQVELESGIPKDRLNLEEELE